MQLYAFDQNHHIIFARDALRQQDYFCPECQATLRLRGGLHRQNHFYHLESVLACRQSGKSIEHLNVQLFFLSTLPKGECALEKRFPEINRIADVVWMDKKIVFEIQCSPISRAEVSERSQDYQRLGYETVWVLHDKRFNQKRMSSAEDFLQNRLHYFTNINAEGKGILYDQFSQVNKGCRVSRLDPLPIEVAHPKFYNAESKRDYEGEKDKKLLQLVKRRLSKQSIYFSNDLIDLSLNSALQDAYLELAWGAEIGSGLEGPRGTFFKRTREFLYYVFVRPYRLFFQLLLERACK